MRFLIWAPEYRYTSGGVDTLHRLCHQLNKFGYISTISTDITNPNWNTPTDKTIHPDTITIYPEIVNGNPFNSPRVVRWVLNNPGHFGGDKFYSLEELVVYWPKYKNGAQNATVYNLTDENELAISFMNPNIFYSDDTPKTKYCYFPDGPINYLPQDKEYIKIENLSLEELGELLRETKIFYSFRDDTAIITEALMCGAKVIYIDSIGNQISWDENINKYLSYIDYSKWTPEFWKSKWENIEEINKFIRLCKKKWGEF
jgi:O-antigen biosynthesis protein